MTTSSTAEIMAGGRLVYMRTTVAAGSWSVINKNIIIDESMLDDVVVTVDGVVFPLLKFFSPQYLPIRDPAATDTVEWGFKPHTRIQRGQTVTVDLPASLITDGVVTSDAETVSGGSVTNNSTFYSLSTNPRMNDLDQHIGATCRIAYVDHISGDDGTGQVYTRSDAEINETPLDPSGAGMLPYKTTYAAWNAAANTTQTHACVLLKRGVTITDVGQTAPHYFNWERRGGVDRDNLLMIGAYGPFSDGFAYLELSDTIRDGVFIRRDNSKFIVCGNGVKGKTKAGTSVGGRLINFNPHSSGTVKESIHFDGWGMEGSERECVIFGATGSVGWRDVCLSNMALADSSDEDAIYADAGTVADNRVKFLQFEDCVLVENGNDALEHGIYSKSIPWLSMTYCAMYTNDLQGAGSKTDHPQIADFARCVIQGANGVTMENNGGSGSGTAVDRSDTQGQGSECLGMHLFECVLESRTAWMHSINSPVDCLIENCIGDVTGSGGKGINARNYNNSAASPDLARDGYRFKIKRSLYTSDTKSLFVLELPDTDTRSAVGVLGYHESDIVSGFFYQSDASAAPIVLFESTTLGNDYDTAKAAGRVDFSITNLGVFNASETETLRDGDGTDYDAAGFVAAVSDATGITVVDPGFSAPRTTISDYIASLGYGTNREYWDAYSADLLDASKERGTNFEIETIADYVLSRHQSSNPTVAAMIPENWAASGEAVVYTRSRDRSRNR